MLAATLLLLGLLAAGGGSASSSQPQAPPEGETWAVIVSSSRYWFNYRHTANALAVYRSLRDLVGVPDDRIILMLADDHACAARNRFSGFVYHFDDDHTPASTVCTPEDPPSVDYGGLETSADTLLRVLLDRASASTPPSRRLWGLTPSSRLFLYLTGHGGEGFLKFHDKEELSSDHLAEALRVMRAAGRLDRALAIFDTCQAASHGERMGGAGGGEGIASSAAASATPPPLVVVSSSRTGENSYAYGTDSALAQPLSDGFTRFLHTWLIGRYGPAPLPVTTASNGVADDGRRYTPSQDLLVGPSVYWSPSGRGGGGAGSRLAALLASSPQWWSVPLPGSRDNNNNSTVVTSSGGVVSGGTMLRNRCTSLTSAPPALRAYCARVGALQQEPKVGEASDASISVLPLHILAPEVLPLPDLGLDSMPRAGHAQRGDGLAVGRAERLMLALQAAAPVHSSGTASPLQAAFAAAGARLRQAWAALGAAASSALPPTLGDALAFVHGKRIGSVVQVSAPDVANAAGGGAVALGVHLADFF